MARVTMTKTRKKKKPMRKERPPKTNRFKRETFELATEESQASDSFFEYSTVLYGEIKIGKTSLCSCIPNATFLCFEAGTKGLKVRRNEPKTWADVRDIERALEKDASRDDRLHGPIIVDVAEEAYKMCLRDVCKKMGILYPLENDFGKSWNAVNTEWSRFVEFLNALPHGVVYLSHAKFSRHLMRDGSEYETLGPTMSGRCLEITTGKADNVFYYGYDEGRRVVVIRGNDLIDAGTRLEDHFLTKVKRRPVQAIDMGDNKKEAYSRLMLAFDNGLTSVGSIPTVVKPKKRGKKKPWR